MRKAPGDDAWQRQGLVVTWTPAGESIPRLPGNSDKSPAFFSRNLSTEGLLMVSDAARHLAGLADDVKAFRHYLESERGMAANTVLAYGRDLDRFAAWVTEGGLGDYLKPNIRELTQYLGHLREGQLAPRSVARHLVALKLFYRFLRLDER